MIRRCLWCKERVRLKVPRYFFDGEWKEAGALTWAQWQRVTDGPITDGICPACVKEARKELKHDKA